MQGWHNKSISMNMMRRIDRTQDKNYTIISIEAEKAFDKSQHSFMIKTLSKLGINGMYLNMIKTICDKPTDNIILNGEKLKAFKIRNKTRMFTHTPSAMLRLILLIQGKKGACLEKEGSCGTHPREITRTLNHFCIRYLCILT